MCFGLRMRCTTRNEDGKRRDVDGCMHAAAEEKLSVLLIESYLVYSSVCPPEVGRGSL